MKYILQYTLMGVLFLFSSVNVQAQLFEDFEEGVKGGYAEGTVELETGIWLFSQALIGTADGDRRNGTRSARIREGFIQMNFNHPGGLSEVSFYASNSGFSGDTGGIAQVSYSTDNGTSWNDLGEPIVLDDTFQQYTVQGSVPGNVRIRITRTAGNRISVDDVRISDFIESSEDPTINMRINGQDFENGGLFDFGATSGTGSATLRLQNTGEEDLEISALDIEGLGFDLSPNPEGTLEPGEISNFTISYEMETPGVYDAYIFFATNDPLNEQVFINLRAETIDVSQPMPISEARQLPQGTLVTVAGIITAADQFRGPVYFQDETGGIGWYSDALMRTSWEIDAVIGDSLVVTGEIGAFNQLTQIVNHSFFEVFPEGNREVQPVNITLEQLNTGEFEGQLVSVSGVEFNDSGIFSGGTNYTVTDGTASGQFRVDNFTNISGATIPNSPANVVAIAGRFLANNQLLPRFRNDITITTGPVIASAPPYTISATASSITFQWETEQPGHSEVRFGLTPDFELGMVKDEEPKTIHTITIDNLDVATTYKVELRSAVDADTSATSIYLSSTGSPEGTTGEILTFFNRGVAHDLATFQEAEQNVNFRDRLIEMIENAEESVDFAFYSISQGAGNDIGDAIIEAHNRGVDVRVIASGHTGNPNAVITRLANNGVRAVQSLGGEQMHNKFAVIDAHHNDPTKTWVITSSWNATDQGTFNQFQNMINIQDVALARAYWREFNQMWGAESGNFNPSQALFSSNKSVVNASSFWIGEDQTYVELYFSPQGNTEAQINRALSTAESSIDLGLNLITRRAISNTMLSRFNDGVKVRGVIGDINVQGSEWDYLSGWADVHFFSQSEFGGLLHHKYAIVDGEQTSDNSKVITGSHNWSGNANFSNDENTLIIHSERVANEFFQEFGARYWQAGGQDQFNVGTHFEEPTLTLPEQVTLDQNYPNPFNPTTNIRFELPIENQVTLQVYDITGRVVATLVDGQSLATGTHTITFDASRLASGIYLYRLQLGDGQVLTRKMTLIK